MSNYYAPCFYRLSTFYRLCSYSFLYRTPFKALDVSKAHGHVGISVKISKICADSIAHPLTLIFQNSLVAGIFADDWKKANIAPVDKKMINKLFQITDYFLFYQYVVKSLKS